MNRAGSAATKACQSPHLRKTIREMNYKNENAKVTQVRKVIWDMLWHVVYVIKGRGTWDRVDEKEALAVARRL